MYDIDNNNNNHHNDEYVYDSHGNAFPKEFVKNEFVKLVEEYQNMPEEERLLRLSKLSPESRGFLSRKLGGCNHD